MLNYRDGDQTKTVQGVPCPVCESRTDAACWLCTGTGWAPLPLAQRWVANGRKAHKDD
jgi:hypothetical protein